MIATKRVKNKPSITLSNVVALDVLIKKIIDRPPEQNLPGIGVFFGDSGLGKSMAATRVATKFDGIHVEIKSVTTKKSLCTQIMHAMNLSTEKTISDMVNAIGQGLADNNWMLILDDAQYLRGSMIELPRDIFEASDSPVILIGERQLPNILMKSERVHNRVLEWGEAKPCNEADCQSLATMYCPDVKVEKDLLDKVMTMTGYNCRRICINLYHINSYARQHKLETIDLASYKGSFVTGRPPR